jgi:predicted nucleotide-binding protein
MSFMIYKERDFYISMSTNSRFSKKVILGATDVLRSRGHASFDRLLLELGIPSPVAGRSLGGLMARGDALARYVLSDPELMTEEGIPLAEAIVRRAEEYARMEPQHAGVEPEGVGRPEARFLNALSQEDGHGSNVETVPGETQSYPPQAAEREFQMARRQTPSTPKSAQLSLDEKRKAIPRLQKRLDELLAFKVEDIGGASDPKLRMLEQGIDRILVEIFGPDTVDYERHREAAQIGPNSHGITLPPSLFGRNDQLIQFVSENLEKSEADLQGIISGFEEDIELAKDSESKANRGSGDMSNRRVFVVHGHDREAKLEVARFLEKAEFKPVILEEQASASRTIIEQIEADSDVDFAVVLLTPDDEGCKKGEVPKPRARQNVLLELGYFMGLLGRAKVCALRRGDPDIPSDFAGVFYKPFDDRGAWKQALGKELQTAGFHIDWSKAMS